MLINYSVLVNQNFAKQYLKFKKIIYTLLISKKAENMIIMILVKR